MIKSVLKRKSVLEKILFFENKKINIRLLERFYFKDIIFLKIRNSYLKIKRVYKN